MNAVDAFPQVATMKTVVVDKIASVTQACGLGHEVRVATDEHSCEEGVVWSSRSSPTSRPTTRSSSPAAAWPRSRKGDVIVGALGHRKALFGYSGHVPESVKPGDIIQMLNIGGVLGICDSVNPDKGKPFDCRVHRRACCSSRISASASACRRASAIAQLDYDAPLDTNGVPVVALAGTCMEAGKTAAACAIVSAHAPSRPRVRRVQGDGRLAAPRHPRDGRRRRAPHA